jgi:hypothetical protein
LIEKDLNIKEVLIDADREKNSASNENIFNESKSDIHGPLSQKLILGLPESASDFCYYPMNFKK